MPPSRQDPPASALTPPLSRDRSPCWNDRGCALREFAR